jgi:pyruvate,orthophosphate dikinase
MTMGLSRDDAGRFLPEYIDESKSAIFKDDPFQTIDVEGVGALVRIAVEGARDRSRNTKIGVCGEHGGDPASIRLFDEIGLDYVSCSPFRVPIARLAAAQATIAGPAARGRIVKANSKPVAAIVGRSVPSPKKKRPKPTRPKTSSKHRARATKSPRKKTRARKR